ncbi:M23 family metallopeptidase [Limnohabitans sp.]|uniref:M23 family metallopeptidase n=1 Tax=Limnohabitans sp. TaxID=1907725 RepID=UPI00286F88D7|nr:M23 family metallopeptidase [Limnohabitans sp.]
MLQRLSQWVQRLHDLHKNHPHRTMAGFALSLCVIGGGAFAVGSLSSNANVTSLNQVVESVPTLALPSDTATAPSLMLFRSDVTRSSDTADSLLSRLGVSDAEASAYLRNARVARSQILARNGRLVTVEGDESRNLTRLTVRWAPDNAADFSRWVMERTATGFTERLESAPLSVSTRHANGVIQSSLFAATDAADIPDSVASQLADIFAGDIDFHRALRKGDRFAVVYETFEADGETLRSGRVVSAEFVNNGKTHQAFWFKEARAKEGGYFNAEGVSLRRSYLASPLAFSRVTSGFKMRFHPILQTWRAHLGVDYAAPTGTPVRSVGQGVVDVAGTQNGFGNVVIVKHTNGQSTVYAHLSRIAVRAGQRVAQGETLGAVGATGWATGPHLHFEFRVNGQHKDPLTMARQSDVVEVSAAARAEFMRHATAAKVDLAAASNAQLSQSE